MFSLQQHSRTKVKLILKKDAYCTPKVVYQSNTIFPFTHLFPSGYSVFTTFVFNTDTDTKIETEFMLDYN